MDTFFLKQNFLEYIYSHQSAIIYGLPRINIGIVHVRDYDELNGFQNIRVFDSIHDLSVLPKTIYWAKNVGIIKKIMPDGTEWTLKNYHVIQ